MNIERVNAMNLDLDSEFGKQNADRARSMFSAMLFGSGRGVDLNEAIQNNLDADSIYAFFHLVVDAARILGDSTIQSERAYKKHAENLALKAEVFAWLDENFTIGSRSMDDVANELAGKLVPVKFRTVRDWMTEWKKWRTTGTP